ncbi:MAG: right-handed parallel beta-helix repeat-containing protein [Candidatus Heimdallarchaeota archaeon]|nr:MAG: right-handed parallel beta-helix repeat-containing protein [Candidatus Heimdallarchaeota archaeon]
MNLGENWLPTLKIISTQAYIESEPITITSNFQLNNSGFPGNGTIDDPIRIEGYNITASSGNLISISGTTYYFCITNCLLDGLTTATNGIRLENVGNGTIEKTIVINTTDNGIYLIASSSNIMTNNTLKNNGIGINLEYSDKNWLINNSVTNNQGWTEINMWASSLNKLINNTISSGNHGIGILDSSNMNTFTNNTIFDIVYAGMLIDHTSENLISDNKFFNTGGGIKVENSSYTTLVSNTIWNSSWQGIWCRFTTFTEITRNTVWNSSSSGIFLRNDTDAKVTENICYNNSYKSRPGQPTHENEYASGSITGIGTRIHISKNNVYNNYHNGILVYWGADVNVSENVVKTNTRNGIAVGWSSNATIIKGNEISENTKQGILCGFIANQSIITHNVCYENEEYGLAITSDTYMNSITQNDFLNNNIEGEQAIDNGSSNTFDQNYWSDWSETGSYAIDGDARNQDLSPQTNPNHLSVPSIITPTTDNLTLSGLVPIQWTASVDTFDHPITYTAFYSSDDGGSWTTLASGLSTTSSTWDTTSIEDHTHVVLKIHSTDSIGFVSKTEPTETFLVINTPHRLSALSITSPTEDTILTGQAEITWIPVVDTWFHEVNYSVYYSVDNATTWVQIVSGITTTTDTWDTTTVTDGTNYLIKVKASCTEGLIVETTLDGPFMVHNGLSLPTISSPNGGETLTGTATIEWSVSHDNLNHSITYIVFYSSDEGATWTELASGLTTTSYSWDTTDVPNGLSYLIKVVATCSEGVMAEDVSNGTFTIHNEIETSTTTPTTTSSETTPGMTVFYLVWILGILIVRKRKRET